MSYALINEPPKADEMTKRYRNMRSICWEMAKQKFPNDKYKRYKFFDLMFETAQAYSRALLERLLSKDLRIPLIYIGSMRPASRKFNNYPTVFSFDSKVLVKEEVKVRRMKLAKNEIIVIKNDGSVEALEAIATVVRSQCRYRVRINRGVVHIDNDLFLNVRIPTGCWFVTVFPGMYISLSNVELFENFRYIRKNENPEILHSPSGSTSNDMPDNLDLIDEALEQVDWFKKESKKEMHGLHIPPLNDKFKQIAPDTYREVYANPAYPSREDKDLMFETLGYKKTIELLYMMRRGYNVDVNIPGIDEQAITDYIVKAGYTEEDIKNDIAEINEQFEDDVDLENFNFES